MARENGYHESFDALRRRAEKAEVSLQAEGQALPGTSSRDIAELLHELRVHQIELELQNEELRETELALTESREKLSDLYEFAPVGYLTLDNAGRITSANLTAATLFGVDRSKFVGKPLSVFVERESQDALHRHLRTVALSQFKQSVDLSIRHSSALPLRFQVDSIAEKIDEGIAGCRCTLTDITELHLAQQELRALNDRLEAQVTARTNELQGANADLHEKTRQRDISAGALALEKEFSDALINTAQAIILVLDRQGRIVSFNRYMQELSGYSLDEVRGEDWFRTFIPERDRKWLRDMFHHAVAHALVRGNTNAIVTKSGEERQIEWFDAQLTTPDGRFTGLLCTGTDVTERRTLEQQLLTIAEREQQRIGQHLHDDIGQELAALRLTMDTVVEGLEAEHSGETEKCLRVTRGLAGALRKLRDVSRGLISVQITAQDLVPALHDLCEGFASVRCRCECHPAATVRNDRLANQLYYIAREALTNAVRHGEVEELQVEVRLVEKDGNLVLTITDNGVGIPEPPRPARGSGLHIMQYRADLIGARLDVEPVAGGGTRVTCTTPRARVSAYSDSGGGMDRS